MTLEPWLRRHPLIGYFALAYGISWGGILIVLGATCFDLVELRPLETGLIFLLMLLGPSTSGLALTALLDGRAGLHRLWSSLTRWRVGVRWYAVALLTMPLLLLAVLWPLRAFVDPAFPMAAVRDRARRRQLRGRRRASAGGDGTGARAGSNFLGVGRITCFFGPIGCYRREGWWRWRFGGRMAGYLLGCAGDGRHRRCGFAIRCGRLRF